MSDDDPKRRRDINSTLESVKLDEISELLVREAADRARSSVNSPSVSTTLHSETDSVFDKSDAESLAAVLRRGDQQNMDQTLSTGDEPRTHDTPLVIEEEDAPDAAPDEVVSERSGTSWVTIIAALVLVAIIILLAMQLGGWC